MLEKNKKDFDNSKSQNKKKHNKLFHDDDTYGASKINKEFKRKKQHLIEEEDWENWDEEYNQ
jgi:hypothetical protein